MAILFAAFAIAFLGSRATLGTESAPEEVVLGSPKAAAKPAPTVDLTPVVDRVETRSHLGGAAASVEETAAAASQKIAGAAAQVPSQQLLLDSGAVPGASLSHLLVYDHGAEFGDSATRYPIIHRDRPSVFLLNPHFPPRDAVEAFGEASEMARRPSRIGMVFGKDSDLLGCVRVPILRRDLRDPVPVEWFGLGTIEVEWTEANPISTDDVQLTMLAAIPDLLQAAMDLRWGLVLNEAVFVDGAGPIRTSSPRPIVEGSYGWEARGGGPGLSGTFDVLQGESHTIFIEPVRREWFTASLEVDASAAPHADLAKVSVMLFHTNRPREGRTLALEQVGKTDVWRTAFFDVSRSDGDGWRIILSPLRGADWSEGTLLVDEDEPHAKVHLLRKGLPFEVRVALVANKSGAPLAFGKLSYGRSFDIQTVARRKGGVFVIEETGAKPLEIYVGAEGYQGQMILWTPGESPPEFEIRLEGGLRERVVAIDARTMAPVAGVPIWIGDRKLGTTSADGVFWITEREPMERPSVDKAWKTVHAGVGSMPFGSLFAVEAPD